MEYIPATTDPVNAPLVFFTNSDDVAVPESITDSPPDAIVAPPVNT